VSLFNTEQTATTHEIIILFIMIHHFIENGGYNSAIFLQRNIYGWLTYTYRKISRLYCINTNYEDIDQSFRHR